MTASLEEYVNAHIDSEPDLLRRLYREAHTKLLYPRMLSGHLQGRLLKMFVQMIRPQRVLEIGAFAGYSALCMAEGLADGATIDTVEIDDELEDFIRKYISLSEHGHKVQLHIGDAMDIVPQFDDECFDLVFLDADKRLYRQHYELVMPKLRKGGFIIADNTLWDGKVTAESVAATDRQTAGIIEFNDALTCDSRIEKVIIPIRDGLTIIRKK